MNAVTVWMIVFAGLWLVATVFLVVLYLDQEQLRNDAAKLRSLKNRAISDAEDRSIELAKDAREGGPTVARLLEDARAETALLATGNAADLPAAVRSARDMVVESIIRDKRVSNPARFADMSLSDALKSLYGEYVTCHDLQFEAEQRKSELESEVERLTALTSRQKADFDEQIQAFTDRLAALERDHNAYRRDRDAAVTSIEQEAEARQKQLREDLERANERSATALKEASRNEARVADLRKKYGDLDIRPATLVTARQPDGAILRAVPGDPVVYIDLGRRAGLTLGLPFTVYSSETGIPPDGKGKARIEVVSISDSFAVCKIVRVARSEVILAGDVIANPIYDRNRPLSFLVIGEFDLNRDGQRDRDGLDTIEAFVRSWGAVVADELTALTDFVVVGAAPPPGRPSGEVPPELAEQNDAVRRVHQRYTDALQGANSMHVPILTQDVFLNFLGYSGRLAQR
ncbi:MAG: hypothetical protein ACE5E6_10045 [Phycisphaerae bacterium]